MILQKLSIPCVLQNLPNKFFYFTPMGVEGEGTFRDVSPSKTSLHFSNFLYYASFFKSHLSLCWIFADQINVKAWLVGGHRLWFYVDKVIDSLVPFVGKIPWRNCLSCCAKKWHCSFSKLNLFCRGTVPLDLFPIMCFVIGTSNKKKKNHSLLLTSSIERSST